MSIKKSDFIKSAISESDYPEIKGIEFSFIGRSNVGKSSLINSLTGRKNLARTSKTPGRTQLINYFIINDENYFDYDIDYYYDKIMNYLINQDKYTLVMIDNVDNIFKINEGVQAIACSIFNFVFVMNQMC